jgi:HEPN domain-containing protein
MPLNDQSSEYWLEIASHDQISARILDAEHGPQDIIIYHYHQCIEKILKAEIVKKKVQIPRIHDLERLFSNMHTPDVEHLIDPIIILNSIAQNARYPQGDQIDEKQYQMAKQAFNTIFAFFQELPEKR